MTGDMETQRTLGRLEAVSESHEERLARMETKIDHLVKVIDEAKGGWKMLVAVGTLTSAFTAAIIKLWALLMGKA